MDEQIFHVTSRGNNGRTIFSDDADYATFLRMLVSAFAGTGWTCHAYCLIPNHYHLLVEIEAIRLRRAMHLLNGRYARRFNQRHAHTGHLFEGPYSATPVERDGHFLEAVRYILLNPVRAGLCALPEEWKWSSYAEEPTTLIREMLGTATSLAAFVLEPLTLTEG